MHRDGEGNQDHTLRMCDCRILGMHAPVAGSHEVDGSLHTSVLMQPNPGTRVLIVHLSPSSHDAVVVCSHLPDAGLHQSAGLGHRSGSYLHAPDLHPRDLAHVRAGHSTGALTQRPVVASQWSFVHSSPSSHVFAVHTHPPGVFVGTHVSHLFRGLHAYADVGVAAAGVADVAVASFAASPVVAVVFVFTADTPFCCVVVVVVVRLRA